MPDNDDDDYLGQAYHEIHADTQGRHYDAEFVTIMGGWLNGHRTYFEVEAWLETVPDDIRNALAQALARNTYE